MDSSGPLAHRKPPAWVIVGGVAVAAVPLVYLLSKHVYNRVGMAIASLRDVPPPQHTEWVSNQ
jgi:cytochrome c-type biogenesis protein CcmH/NrfG